MLAALSKAIWAKLAVVCADASDAVLAEASTETPATLGAESIGWRRSGLAVRHTEHAFSVSLLRSVQR